VLVSVRLPSLFGSPVISVKLYEQKFGVTYPQLGLTLKSWKA